MTTREACDEIVALVKDLAAVRGELAVWRSIGVQAIHHAHALHVELERVKSRYVQLLDERRADRRPAASGERAA